MFVARRLCRQGSADVPACCAGRSEVHLPMMHPFARPVKRHLRPGWNAPGCSRTNERRPARGKAPWQGSSVL